MSKMMTISEAVEKWGISNSMLARLCREGRIPGAEKVKKSWMIPADAQYPADARTKKGSVPVKKKQLLPLPIGISDYRKASSEYYYIDKTLMIRDFLDEVPMVSLFTRPRRFGKTLNMDMLRTFFEKTEEDNACPKRLNSLTVCALSNHWSAKEHRSKCALPADPLAPDPVSHHRILESTQYYYSPEAFLPSHMFWLSV